MKLFQVKLQGPRPARVSLEPRVCKRPRGWLSLTVQPPPCRSTCPRCPQLLPCQEPPDSAGLLFDSLLLLQEL